MSAGGDGGEVILFPKVKDDDPPIEPPATIKPRPKAWERSKGCTHAGRSTLDETAHALLCSDCGQVLDAFEWIRRFVQRWDRVNTDYQQARQQCSATHERLADLERRERNAKARIRKATAPELVAARKAVEQASRAIYRTIEAMREFGISDGDALYAKVYDARSALRVAYDALADAEPEGDAA